MGSTDEKAKHDWTTDPEWHNDMLHAFEQAAESIESHEFDGFTRKESDRQNAAYDEVAKRIRAMGARYLRANK